MSGLQNVNIDVKQMKCILCSSERIIFQLKNSDTCCLICLDTYMKQNPYKSFGYFHRDDHGSSWKERISHAFECSSVYPFSNRFSSFHLGQFTLRQTRCRKDRDIVQMFRNQTIAYDFFSEWGKPSEDFVQNEYASQIRVQFILVQILTD